MTAHRHVVLGRIVGVALSAVAMMWAAVTLAFLAVHIAPGDPVTAIMGESSDPTQRARIEQDWGLDQPIGVQYVRHLDRLLHGDLGYSYVRGEPVTDILFGEQLGTSAQLAGFALLIAVVLAPLLAVLTAGRRDVFSRALGTAEVVLASAPPFWMGLILIWIFAFTLKVLPVTAGNEFQRLILPAVTLALPIAAVLAQVMREGIERALEQPFALTARSRGISTTRLRLRHGLRHSLIPAATLAGWAVSGLLTGTVVIEEVFGRAGIGRATVEAVTYSDVPVVLGVALLTAAIYLTVTVLVDIAYLWIDPRLREATP
ncbi:ABC transporter permease [Nocardia cyriacigeorgica]|uniref:ABC transporter permease n=1 Tax=Nocardia cyriacigeorgica TaxID=135487 RepID=UPI0018956948|nr:ABC transporter permease [Nocardia cyriacigeorgica]MBF6437358.1 ABC transporter permease [Nocardia cyriacigeorgica]MBF6452928.1 ABC transporter permease [Nocardia cyriacigeorgica]MBF6478688.1 ABC transporter permease [Nocardia cyriacigeorgica]MBF6550097.1 ABC transporter permease [Nocardia cyriacigeorgica]